MFIIILPSISKRVQRFSHNLLGDERPSFEKEHISKIKTGPTFSIGNPRIAGSRWNKARTIQTTITINITTEIFMHRPSLIVINCL